MRSSKLIGDSERKINFTKNGYKQNNNSNKLGEIFVVGIGPGDSAYMTKRVLEIWDKVEIVAGYKTYIDLIRPFLKNQRITSTSMRQEVERCHEVVDLAVKGHKVALISSGDAGIYGMAGILIECLSQRERLDIPLEIIPGVTAANASASILGAPLMHDFAVISLSDLLTPWEVITKRVHLAAEGDFVLAIYNPKSKGRTTQIETIREIVLKYRSSSTPVGLVRNALRGNDSSMVITNLADFLKYPIDMLTTVIIGNSQTKLIGQYMVTPRGYNI